MKQIAIILIILISFSYIMADEVNIILKDGSVIKGNLIGQTREEIFIQDSSGKSENIKIADINKVFDSATGNPLDLTELAVVQAKPDYGFMPQIKGEGPKNAVGIDFPGLFLNYYRLSYERSLNDWFSLKLDAAYSPDYFWGNGITLWNAILSGRFYLNGAFPMFYFRNKSLNGIFLGIGFGYEGASVNYSYSGSRGSFQINGTYAPAPLASLELGNKIVFGLKSGFYIEPHIGYEIGFGSWSYSYSGTGAYSAGNVQVLLPYNGLGNPFTYGIELGYAF